MEDARAFVFGGPFDPAEFQRLVRALADSAYAKYPSLTRRGVEAAVLHFF